MVPLTSAMMIILLIASAITALSILSVFANIVRHETKLHDLRNHVKDLNYQHELYLARIDGRISDRGEVEILEDDDEPSLTPSPSQESTEHAPDTAPPAADPANPAPAIAA